MIEPTALIETARQLLSAPLALDGPSEASIRRSMSTAYYAMFHHLMRAAADRFVGTALRGMAAHLTDSLKDQMGRSTAPSDIRHFAAVFLIMQELRELADYEPAAFASAKGRWAEFVDRAQTAMAAFDLAEDEERTTVLALMLLPARR